MTRRHQRGWLKKEKRSQGETWALFFRTVPKSDGKRVENKLSIGLLEDFSSKSCAWGRSNDDTSASTRWISAELRGVQQQR